MKKNLRLTIIILIVMLLAGCTKPLQNIDPSPETGADNGTIPVTREDEGPKQGGTLNLFMVKPDTLNPLTTQNATVRHLSSFVFDPLFFELEDGTTENALVDSYSFSSDGLVLDVKLKDNILFHDGQALTSDDASFTIETIIDAGTKSLYSGNALNIQSVKAVDRLSLRIILKKPDSRFIDKLTFPIVPQHVFKDWPIEGYSDNLKLIGTGPFKFESYDEKAVKLLRNDSWWYQKAAGGLDHPIWLDGITFKVYPDESSMLQAFQKREIDIAWLDEGESEGYADRSDIFYNKYKTNTLEFLAFSATGKTTNSPIALEPFRSLILRYLSWYETSMPLNKGEPALDAVPEFSSKESMLNRESVITALEVAGFTYQKDKNTLIYNKNAAKIPITLSVKYNTLNTDRQETADWITAALFEIGIQVIPEASSYSDQQSSVQGGKFDMILLGCNIPLYADMPDTLSLIKESLNLGGQNAAVLPLYHKSGAVLYHNRIRGSRIPFWKNIYNGWSEWYLVGSQP